MIYILGYDHSGNPVFLRDIWPSRLELQEVERQYVLPVMFKETYAKVTEGNRNWNALRAYDSQLYPWDVKSTYVKNPPFFDNMTLDLPAMQPIKDAYVLLNLGDSVTTGTSLFTLQEHYLHISVMCWKACTIRYSWDHILYIISFFSSFYSLNLNEPTY